MSSVETKYYLPETHSIILQEEAQRYGQTIKDYTERSLGLVSLWGTIHIAAPPDSSIELGLLYNETDCFEVFDFTTQLADIRAIDSTPDSSLPADPFTERFILNYELDNITRQNVAVLEEQWMATTPEVLTIGVGSLSYLLGNMSPEVDHIAIINDEIFTVPLGDIIGT